MRDATDLAGGVVEICDASERVGNRDKLVGDGIAVAIGVGETGRIGIGVDDAREQTGRGEIGDDAGFAGENESIAAGFDKCIALGTDTPGASCVSTVIMGLKTESLR